MLNRIKQYGSGIGKGLLKEVTPGIAGGFINELFHQWKVDKAKLIQDVQSNYSLVKNMTPEQQGQLNNLVKTVGNLDFLTPELVINSVKKDFPKVAALFVNWPEAAEWLTRQIEEIKSKSQAPD